MNHSRFTPEQLEAFRQRMLAADPDRNRIWEWLQWLDGPVEGRDALVWSILGFLGLCALVGFLHWMAPKWPFGG